MIQLIKNFVYLELAIFIGWMFFRYNLNQRFKQSFGHHQFIVISVFNFALFFSPLLALLHAVMLVAPPILARTRAKLITVMIVGVFGVPELQVNLQMGSIPLFPWSLQTTLGFAGLVTLFMTQRNPERQRLTLNISLVIFLLMLAAIFARGTSATSWLRQLVSMLVTYGLPATVIAHCIDSPRMRIWFASTLAAMGSMLAAIMTYEARTNWPLYQILLDKYDMRAVGVVIKIRGGLIRAYGPLEEATNAGFALVITLAAALASRAVFKPGLLRYAVPALILIGLLAPQSRGAQIGAGVAMLGYAWYRYGGAGLMKMSALLAPVGGLFYLRYLAASSRLADATETADYRERLFERGVEEFWRNPVIGATYDDVVSRMQDLVQGEGIVDFVNSYLYFALLGGAVGLILFCIMLFYPLGRLMTLRRQMLTNAELSETAAFAFAALLAASVMLAFASIPPRPVLILLMVAGLALSIRPVRATGTAKPGKRLMTPVQESPV